MVYSRIVRYVAGTVWLVLLVFTTASAPGLELFGDTLKVDLSSGLSFYNVDVEGDTDGFLARTRRGNDLKLSVGSTIVTRTRIVARGKPRKDISIMLELDDGLYPSLRKLNLRWTPADWYVNLGNRKASLPEVTLPMDMRSQFGVSLGRRRRREHLHLSTGRLTTQFRRDIFFGDETVGPYFLGQELIVSGSEIVIIDNTKVFKGNDYTIDYRHGTITFQRPLRTSERVTVDYEYDSFFGIGHNRISGGTYRRRLNRWLTAGISGAAQRLSVSEAGRIFKLDHNVNGLDLEVSPPGGGYSLKCEAAASTREETGQEKKDEAFKARWQAELGNIMHTGFFESYGPEFSSIGWAGEKNDRKITQLGFSRRQTEGISWKINAQEHTTVQDRQIGLMRKRELGSLGLSFKASRRRRMIVELTGENEQWRDCAVNPLFDRRRASARGNLKWRVRKLLLESMFGWERERDLTALSQSTERFAEVSAKGRPSRYLVSTARVRRTDISASKDTGSYRNLYHFGCQTERFFTCRLDGVATMTEASEDPRWRELVSRVSLDSEIIRPLRLEARYENRRKEIPATGVKTGSSAWTGGARLKLSGIMVAEASYSMRSTAGKTWRHERIGKVSVRYFGIKEVNISLGREMFRNRQSAANADYNGSVSYLQAMARF